MTKSHITICGIGAGVFFAGTLFYSLMNTSAAIRMFPKMPGVPAAILIAAFTLLSASALFSFLKEKNVLTYGLCFLPATAIWMSISGDRGWSWAAITLTAATISISRLNWPDDARNSTLAWTGTGVMVVVLAFCAAIAQGTI